MNPENQKIVLFLRNSSSYSVENIVKNFKKHFPIEINVKIYKLKYPNTGILNKIKNIFDAKYHEGDINHITGDVHYISYLLKKKKTILTILDCQKLVNNEYGIFKELLYEFFWFTIPNLRTNKITTISESSKKDIIKYGKIKKEKIKRIYIGIDPIFKKIKISQEEKKEILKNPKNKITIFHISNDKSNKNINRLIKAIKDLDIKFIKVGKLSKKSKNLLKKNKIDYIQFENVSNKFLRKVYNYVDCLVFPSKFEGFGMPIIEAQKCGCPVITSNCSSMPEVAGKGAYYVNPYSVKDIKNAIKKVLNSDKLRKEMIKKGFENSKRFEWKNITNKYLEIYEEIK